MFYGYMCSFLFYNLNREIRHNNVPILVKNIALFRICDVYGAAERVGFIIPCFIKNKSIN
jgi:hypothetical protein